LHCNVYSLNRYLLAEATWQTNEQNCKLHFSNKYEIKPNIFRSNIFFIFIFLTKDEQKVEHKTIFTTQNIT